VLERAIMFRNAVGPSADVLAGLTKEKWQEGIRAYRGLARRSGKRWKQSSAKKLFDD
jgi:hypothetical protein